MMIRNEVLRYILNFLCGDNDIAAQNVGYVKNISEGKVSKVVILQSCFFDEGVYGKEKSLPVLPLSELEGVPLLFGEPRIEKQNGQVIIYSDIVASTYFLISRYEEMVRPTVRDAYGRFPGKESLPGMAGFIQRPVVDEYGKILRRYLREAGINVKEPEKGFSKIYLTHDVDVPWEHFTWYTAFKRILGELKRKKHFTIYPLQNLLGNPDHDPRYTFQHLIDADKAVPNAESIYFIKSTGCSPPQDYVPYIQKKGTRKLLRLLRGSNATLGYHVSYAAGKDTGKVADELVRLTDALGERVTRSRNHYLASLEPHDFYSLIDNGITDDYTMGYADLAGFRLGTCCPVRWIDPEKGKLTDLVLHPLTIMECSLTDDKYMGLGEASSQEYGKQLILSVFNNFGELILLWHNSSNIGNGDSVDWKNYNQFLMAIKRMACCLNNPQEGHGL